MDDVTLVVGLCVLAGLLVTVAAVDVAQGWRRWQENEEAAAARLGALRDQLVEDAKSGRLPPDSCHERRADGDNTGLHRT